MVLACLAGMTAGLASASAAQEVEFFAHQSSNDLEALEGAKGLGLAGRFPLLEWLDVRVALSLRSGESGGIEEVCTQWQPRWQCYDEPVSYESSLQEASVTLLPALVRTDNIRLAVGGGMTLNKLHSNGDGESGRPVPVNMPSGAQRGFVGLADLSISPGRRSPFVIVARAKFHRAELDGCIPDDPNIPVVERFCGSYTFKEVQVGVAFRF
jgi:hypothetical protein